jgi:hypothetical protein
MTLEHAAREAAGNWRSWTCFVWDREREINGAENWSIIYTHNRDSGLLAQSNAAAVADVLRLFSESENPHVVFERHAHWAVGHVDGFSMQVYRDGEITDAFHTYHGLMGQLDGYPVLDEADYSSREYEAALENTEDAAWRFMSTYDCMTAGKRKSTSGSRFAAPVPLQTRTIEALTLPSTTFSMPSMAWVMCDTLVEEKEGVAWSAATLPTS